MIAKPRFLDAGETALVVEFGQIIDPDINARVLALDATITTAPPPGVIETVPTYRSLMVHYDPLAISRTDLITFVTAALDAPRPSSSARRLVTLPACYDPEFAEDMDHVSTVTGLAADEVVRLHSTAHLTVTMYGFAPGWAYLGGLPKALALPRRGSPRALIPTGSLIIAGGQAIVATMAMPSGWHIIGRTAERLFRPESEIAFPVAVGDMLTFDPVDRATHDALVLRAAAGEVLAKSRPL
jgi:inhibitor of KinA